MTMPHSWLNAAVVPAMLLLASCSTARVPPSAAPSGTPAGTAAERERAGYTEADVRFLRGMIGHHQQALDMAALVPERTDDPKIQLLAERIEVSQTDEIATMRRWLERHGEGAPPPGGSHAGPGHHALVPGMLTPEEMQRLRSARGGEFDRLFLESMIRHHEGALVMVEDLFASPGAGQEPEIYNLASEVDADQRMEIARMQRMLEALERG